MSLRNVVCLLTAAVAVSACNQSGGNVIVRSTPKASHINNTVKFTAAAYGVAASPRLTTSKHVRKGGGRRQLGKPYKIRGKWYTPREQPDYDKTGSASWYGPNFHGRLTANGEIYDQFALSAAHPTFPLPSYARVTNTETGHSIVVRVNDRGPYHKGRIIDLSARASEMLGYQHQGVGHVRVQYVGPAPLHGLDTNFLEASFRPGHVFLVSTNTDAQLAQDKAGAQQQMARNVDRRTTAAVKPAPQFQETVRNAEKKDDNTTLALRFRQRQSEHLR